MAFLIVEDVFEKVQAMLVEEAGKKSLFITGPFLQGEELNRNGRSYPDRILTREAERYIKNYVETNRALGELNHPERPNVDPERATHMITSLVKDGYNWIGKAKVLNTPLGNLVRGMIEDGVSLGVSSRGLGSIKETAQGKIVQDDYYLSTIDIVSDPSAQIAWVNGVYEGKEWACPNEDQAKKIMAEIDASVKSNHGINEAAILAKFNEFIRAI